MNRRVLIPILFVAVIALLVTILGTSGKAPPASFELGDTRLRLLTDGGAVLDATGSGPRDHPQSKTACRVSRTMRLAGDGTMSVVDVCTDEKGNRYTDKAAGKWHIADGLLCLDPGKLDPSPACWKVEYKDGNFSLLDRQLNAGWTMTAANPKFRNYNDLVATLASH